MGRRSFTPEFKLEAVKLVRERGMTVAQAARYLGLHAYVLTFSRRHFPQRVDLEFSVKWTA
jgi:transposase-like protein